MQIASKTSKLGAHMRSLQKFLDKSATSREELALRLGVSEGLVTHWLNGRRMIQPEQVLKVAKMSAWTVRPHDLRPDIYPNPTDAMPRKAA